MMSWSKSPRWRLNPDTMTKCCSKEFQRFDPKLTRTVSAITVISHDAAAGVRSNSVDTQPYGVVTGVQTLRALVHICSGEMIKGHFYSSTQTGLFVGQENFILKCPCFLFTKVAVIEFVHFMGKITYCSLQIQFLILVFKSLPIIANSLHWKCLVQFDDLLRLNINTRPTLLHFSYQTSCLFLFC